MKKLVILCLLVSFLTIPAFAQSDIETYREANPEWYGLCEKYEYVGVIGYYVYAKTSLWTQEGCLTFFDPTTCIWRNDKRDFSSHKWEEFKCRGEELELR